MNNTILSLTLLVAALDGKAAETGSGFKDLQPKVLKPDRRYLVTPKSLRTSLAIFSASL